MQWKLMSKQEAKSITDAWQKDDPEKFASMVASWPDTIPGNLDDDYRGLREKVLEIYGKAATEVSGNDRLKNRKDYQTDLRFALYLYDMLKKYGFSVRTASIDQVWIYLSVNVFPDIVNKRYPGTGRGSGDGQGKNINEDRYWRKTRRIYLKVIWWYIYLSMQTDSNGQDDLRATYEILEGNSTDEIVQTVERCGSYGYRVDVYREIMKFYSENRPKYDNACFRKAMVLNTARAKVVEPALMEGGVRGYVKELFEYFDK